MLSVGVARGIALPLRDLGDLRKGHEWESIPAHRKELATFRAGDALTLIGRGWDAPDKGRGWFALQEREIERQVGDEERMRLLKHDGVPFVPVVFGRVNGRRG